MDLQSTAFATRRHPTLKTAGGVRDLDPLNLITNRVVIQFGLLYARKKENGGPPSRTDLTH